SGVSGDGYWLNFSFWGEEAWIGSAPELVKVEGDLSTLGAAPLAGEAPALVDFALAPAVPVPGAPFRLNLHLGSDAPAGTFVIAGALEESFFLIPVQFLAGAGSHQVETEVVAPMATGWHDLVLALDVENQLGKGSEEIIPIFVDHPRSSKGRLRIEAYSNYNPDGGAADVSWDGDTLRILGEAKLGVLPGPLSEMHYDAILAERDDVPRSELKPGALISLWTNESKRGLLLVRALEVDDLVVDVFIYNVETQPRSLIPR
ncbi:MAG: hypothetical protein IT322_21205, partial [Anaerolineae bacterium]|nr:hypothetical protein [Anaerolineae bacterium]